MFVDIFISSATDCEVPGEGGLSLLICEAQSPKVRRGPVHSLSKASFEEGMNRNPLRTCEWHLLELCKPAM